MGQHNIQTQVASAPALYEKFMYVIGIGGQLMLYIQAYHIFSAESAQDVSLVAFLCSFISVANWLIYGLFIKNPVLVISNVFAVIGSLLVIIGILKYAF